LLPITSVGVIDRHAGTLRFPWEPWEIISNVELCLDGLVTAALLPVPQDNAAGREGWWAAELFVWMSENGQSCSQPSWNSPEKFVQA
jgi:hypothetical protein